MAFQETVARLRGPGGCPWDREQTFASLRPFMIEECYEAVAASELLSANSEGAAHGFCDELGDVLLQVFLNSEIAREERLFSVADVFDIINEKMIRRHPHVFAAEQHSVTGVDDVLTQWAKIKSKESEQKAQEAKSLLDKVSKKRSLPTLAFGCAISKKALSLGFSWNELRDIFGDLESEVRELSAEVFAGEPDPHRIADEAGDVIYALCNIITFLRERRDNCSHLDLDMAARGAFDKFLTRFREMEKILSERGKKLSEDDARALTLEEWNDLWKLAKVRLSRSC